MAAAPTDGELVVAYAEFVLAQGDPNRGAALLEEAERVSPTAATYIARARVYSNIGRRDAALVDLEIALQKEPGSIDAVIALGELYRDMGDTANAQRILEGAAVKAPALQGNQKPMFRRR
jgi:tetratricopeptide (TPR) repeat protein